MQARRFKTNPAYKEICLLDQMLSEAGIPHIMERLYDGWHIRYPYPSEGNFSASAIEHCFSYGSRDDTIELMGLLTQQEPQFDSVVGGLTAKEVFERIQKHWEVQHG